MDIEGHPNYLIYDDGRVWSKKRKGIWLKPFPNPKGYLLVDLDCQYLTVHRIVAEHYIPNPENKPQVDHIDRNRLNNHVSNLRWVTCQENIDNRGMCSTNKSGHKYISYNNEKKKWLFQYRKRGHKKSKIFKTKTDALCYKYIYLMKVQVTH